MNRIATCQPQRRLLPTEIDGVPAATLAAGPWPVRTVVRTADGRLEQFDWTPWIRHAVLRAHSKGFPHLPSSVMTTNRSITVVSPDGSCWHAILRWSGQGFVLDVTDLPAEGGEC